MKIFFEKLRTIIMTDPYLGTFLAVPDEQVHVVSISAVENPKFPCITFERGVGITDPWVLSRNELGFVIRIFGKNNYEELEDLYHDESPGVISAYGYSRGVRDLLHGQRYMASSPYIEQILELSIPKYGFEDWSKTYYLEIPFKALVMGTTNIEVR